MWPGPRPTSMPSFILIHPTVWPQYTNVTGRANRQDREDRQTGQRSDSIRRTVFTNGRPKFTESIEMSFGLWTRVGPTKPALGRVHTGATWRIPLNRLYAAAMRPYCQITLTTCCCGGPDALMPVDVAHIVMLKSTVK